jgi:hemoglobin
MTIEYVRYRIPAERSKDFLSAYGRAGQHLAAAPECKGFELARCEEDQEAYVLRIHWTSTEAHLTDFRGGPHFPPFLAEIRGYVDDIEEMRHYQPTEVIGGDLHVETPPSLYEWAGGEAAFERLTETFYQHVLADDLLEPVFRGMDPAHPRHVALWLAEVFGGPATYTAERGGYSHMLGKHLGRAITETQRRRWVNLLLDAADEVGLPADPEFRAAFASYLEWGTRLAVENSRPGATPPPEAPVPHWGWGVAPPWTG